MEERRHKSTHPSPHRQRLPMPPTLKSGQRNRRQGSVLHPLQVQHVPVIDPIRRLPRRQRRKLFMINRREKAKIHQDIYQKKQRGFWEQHPTPEPRPDDRSQPIDHKGQKDHPTAEKKINSIPRTQRPTQPNLGDTNKHSVSDTDTITRIMRDQTISDRDLTTMPPPSTIMAKDKTLTPTPTRTPIRKPSPIPYHDLPKRTHAIHHPPSHQPEKGPTTEVNSKPPVEDIHSQEHDYWKRCKLSTN